MIRLIYNVDAITPPITGIGQYALQLGHALRQHPALSSCRFFSADRWIEDLDAVLHSNRRLAWVRKHVPFKHLALRLYNRHRNRAFGRLTRGLEDHVLHSPNFLLMPFDGPSVVTVHDLSHRHHPQAHPPERVAFLDQQLPLTLQRADAVITDSAFVREELLRLYSLPPERVHAVHLGVSPMFHRRDAQTLEAIKLRHDLPARFLLCVATLEPRKNLPRLLRAYAGLPEALRRDCPLVLTGDRGWGKQALFSQARALLNEGQVRFTGYVNNSDLGALYAAAHGVVLPSLYEGFGLPVIEAFASGTPVLCSNAASLPEVAGGCALLADPNDVEALRAGLLRLCEDADWRRAAQSQGLSRAQHFTWARCADETVAVYRAALNR